MSLCSKCGNQITVPGCEPDPEYWTPICLVCQHTGRAVECIGFDPAVPGTDKTVAMEAHARGLAAALDAIYTAMENAEAKLTVIEAQQMLRHRIRFPEHHRERPDWGEIDTEERERQEICQTCHGTGRYLAQPCPDCQED